MQKLTFHLKSLDNTIILATQIAAILKPGDTIALYGDLGTGKTSIARQIIRELVGPDQNDNPINVISPTFNLLQKYSYDPNKKTNISPDIHHHDGIFNLSLLHRTSSKKYNNLIDIFHFDLYRLNYEEEVFELGIEEAWDNNISIIEWPEIIDNLLPKDSIKIHLSTLQDNTRECIISIE